MFPLLFSFLDRFRDVGVVMNVLELDGTCSTESGRKSIQILKTISRSSIVGNLREQFHVGTVVFLYHCARGNLLLLMCGKSANQNSLCFWQHQPSAISCHYIGQNRDTYANDRYKTNTKTNLS